MSVEKIVFDYVKYIHIDPTKCPACGFNIIVECCSFIKGCGWFCPKCKTLSIHDEEIQKMVGDNVSTLPMIPKSPYSFGETLKASEKVRRID
ncbi:MAG: hypothetical protein JHC41_01785 [Nitrosopumilus sp.]|jgi:hypothetical protein|nr:hypothetical protein [Nitrosopumilus sp.]